MEGNADQPVKLEITPQESRIPQEIPVVKEANVMPKAFEGSEYAKMREASKNSGLPFTVLFTDIDNTFSLKGSEETTSEVSKTAKEGNIPIVAVTGNDFEGVKRRIDSVELPAFSVIAGSVGTEIWVLRPDAEGNISYVKDEEFEAKLISSGFDRLAIARLSQNLIEQSRKDHSDWELDFQDPVSEVGYLNNPQDAEVEPYKVSFYAFSSSLDSVKQMRESFEDRFPRQEIVICEEINHNSRMLEGYTRKKYCIDVLPITKAGAVNYIKDETGVAIAVVAGDSGNDTEMLTGAGEIAVSVGGSKPELTKTLKEAAEPKSGKSSFRKVEKPDGTTKLYYGEKGERLGPESLIYAGKVLARAQAVFGKK